ncbi:helix-turn-helix domain-containing protein [Nocardioides sp.]|uniref:PucR family transcriptional regulator n=1 Tax=Nocardioides sp. TaxID=35761 RepID=UPI002D7F1778|nr:helix-turn-helix domain-containing protein [Nocardioides sp.]HET8959265.1 helix-turn-helix domain-containing protein [Nocardioides sp.]
MISGDDAAAVLARVDALHTALTDIVLEGGDLDRIAAEVGKVLDVGVLFTSTDGRERAAAMDPVQRAALDAADFIDASGRVRVEKIAGGGRSLGPGQVRSLRVAAGGEDLARLVCCRTDVPIPENDVHALERAAAVAALLITREEAVTAVENKYQGDFLRDLFLRRAGDDQYVEEHAEAFGWDLRRPVVVVVAELDPPRPGEDASGPQRRRWQDRFSSAWRQVTTTLEKGVPSVDFSSEVVALLPVTGSDDTPWPGHGVVRTVVAAVAGDRGGGRRPFSVGVSRVAGSLAELPEAYAQARRTVQVGRRIHGDGSTTFFDQLGVHRLIALVPDVEELRSFARDVLGPVGEPTAASADLRATLRILLDTNFNVAEAARLQFFHYNTMRYRVGKLERLLGPLSSDANLRLDVAVALRVLEIAS